MDDRIPPSGERHCPICGKPTEPRFRPFCSARCRLVDLGRWLGEGYRIESDEPPEDEQTE
jgi:hypothetical protein